ncbi:MAG: outer membrane beta-barrel protein [Kiritimatiellaeota bacterium]|nr:outer membrane beta-barrel protein [Kiritimatiellota bacterium]
MKKFTCYAAAFVLLALPIKMARGEMYAEVYGGWNSAANVSDPFSVTPDARLGVPPFRANYPGHIDSAFEIGIKLGAWFDKHGWLGAEPPDWMQHWGCYLDYSHHSLNFPSQAGTKTLHWPPPYGPYTYDFIADSSGRADTIAFLLAYRYGLWPDTEVPFGRLQPYVAVGPAILFSSQHPEATTPPSGPDLKHDDFGSDSQITVAWEAEAGMRWMVRKNVSLDFSLKYRYAKPSYDFSIVDEEGFQHSVTMANTYQLYSFQLGAAYHF